MRVKTSGTIKISPQKLGTIVDTIRNLTLENATNQMYFCKRIGSKKIWDMLNTATAISENNYNLDTGKLVVDEILVSKGKFLKRLKCRARGRSNRINKPYSKITIYLKEKK